MRRLLIAGSLALTTLTAGCSGCTALTTAVGVVSAPSRTAVDEKAVLTAEVAYGVALDTVTAGARDGRIKGAQAAQVAVVIRRAIPVREAVHTALRGANETDLIAKFNDLKQLTAELVAIGAQ